MCKNCDPHPSQSANSKCCEDLSTERQNPPDANNRVEPVTEALTSASIDNQTVPLQDNN
jgi:hypothetical protein